MIDDRYAPYAAFLLGDGAFALSRSRLPALRAAACAQS